MGSLRSYDPVQAAQVLALLQARGMGGVLSTECIALNLPNLQQRIAELREAGWPIRSRRHPSTRLVTYYLPPGSVQGPAISPVESGCRIIRREDGSITVKAYDEGDGSEDLAERLRGMIDLIWPEVLAVPQGSQDEEPDAHPETEVDEEADWLEWVARLVDGAAPDPEPPVAEELLDIDAWLLDDE